MQYIRRSLDHRRVQHRATEVSQSDDLRFLQQDLLPPLAEAGQEESSAAGDGSQVAARARRSRSLRMVRASSGLMLSATLVVRCCAIPDSRLKNCWWIQEASSARDEPALVARGLLWSGISSARAALGPCTSFATRREALVIPRAHGLYHHRGEKAKRWLGDLHSLLSQNLPCERGWAIATCDTSAFPGSSGEFPSVLASAILFTRLHTRFSEPKSDHPRVRLLTLTSVHVLAHNWARRQPQLALDSAFAHRRGDKLRTHYWQFVVTAQR